MITRAPEPGASAIAGRGYQLQLPEGFTELPLVEEDLGTPEDVQTLIGRVAAVFGLSPQDDNARAATAMFTGLGLIAGSRDVEYASLAFYKSPDDPLRPIMVMLTGMTMASDHHHKESAIVALLESLKQDPDNTVSEVRLPIGPAVAVVSEEQNQLSLADEPIVVLTRQVSAWVPDPDGTTIGIATVTTNSYQDWVHVCRLALDIFDSFEWEPLGGGRG